MIGITAIIPTYNHSSLIGEALDALSSQTSKLDEILVINDGSTDNTAAILDSWVSRLPQLKVFTNERNLGIEESVRRGISTASQAFLLLIGDDDPLMPDAVQKLRELILLNPQLSFACCEYQYEDQHGKLHSMSQKFSAVPKYFSKEDLITRLLSIPQISFPTSCCVWRKSALTEAGGFRPELKWHCDWFAAWTIILRHGLAYRSDVVQTIRGDSNSYSARGQNDPEQQSHVIKAILETLARPEFADVRDLFRLPAVISRFGIPLLKAIIENPKYHDMLTDSLMQTILVMSGYNLNNQAMESLRQSMRVSACQMILQQLGHCR